jgi:hypothetical protein
MKRAFKRYKVYFESHHLNTGDWGVSRITQSPKACIIVPSHLNISAKIGRIVVQRQPGQKVSNKLSMVVYICNPSYERGKGKSITVPACCPGKKCKTLSEK